RPPLFPYTTLFRSPCSSSGNSIFTRQSSAISGATLEEASRVLRGALDAHVLERGRCGHAAAGRSLEEALLKQVRLVHVLDGVGLLAHRHRQRGEPHRAALELLADRAEDVAVEAVEAGMVHLEQVERLLGHLAVDAPRAAHL